MAHLEQDSTGQLFASKDNARTELNSYTLRCVTKSYKSRRDQRLAPTAGDLGSAWPACDGLPGDCIDSIVPAHLYSSTPYPNTIAGARVAARAAR